MKKLGWIGIVMILGVMIWGFIDNTSYRIPIERSLAGFLAFLFVMLGIWLMILGSGVLDKENRNEGCGSKPSRRNERGLTVLGLVEVLLVVAILTAAIGIGLSLHYQKAAKADMGISKTLIAKDRLDAEIKKTEKNIRDLINQGKFDEARFKLKGLEELEGLQNLLNNLAAERK